MATLKEYRSEQLEKLAKLKQAGINPYPASSHKDAEISTIVENFDDFVGKTVCLAGRLLGQRRHGKLEFIDLGSEKGKIQLIVKEDGLVEADPSANELSLEQFNLLTRGDFIEVVGVVSYSKTKQKSIEVSKLRLLTKALRPLPEEITNIETCRRQPYLDLAVNPDTRERFRQRSRFWQATRDFLNKNGFIEINIPILEHVPGGADAIPFTTHMNAINEDFYLRMSHELPLKKLIGGGYDRVYDIGARFRNENYSEEHLPEHVAMEWYCAYADWTFGMKFMEKMFPEVLGATFNKTTFKWKGQTIDLTSRWEKINYSDIIAETYDGLDISKTSVEAVKEQLNKHSIEIEEPATLGQMIDKLWTNCRSRVAGPAWLIMPPVMISPLAKRDPKNPTLAQRFQPVFAGTEMANGFSELNDPIDQLERFVDQQKQRLAGNKEAHMIDIDYVEMLEYGIPPTCGFGYSERVFWTMAGVPARDGVVFPALRPKISNQTKEIYPELYGKDGLLTKDS